MNAAQTSEQIQKRTIANVALEAASNATGIKAEQLAGVSYDVRVHSKESALWLGVRKSLTRSFPELVGNPNYVRVLQDRLLVLRRAAELAEKIEQLMNVDSVFRPSVHRGKVHVKRPLLLGEISDADRRALDEIAGESGYKLRVLLEGLQLSAEHVAHATNRLLPLHPIALTDKRRAENAEQRIRFYFKMLHEDEGFAAAKQSVREVIVEPTWRAELGVLDAHSFEINRGVYLIGHIKVLDELIKERVSDWRPFLDAYEGQEALAKLGLDDGQRPEIKIAALIDHAKGSDFVPSQSF